MVLYFTSIYLQQNLQRKSFLDMKHVIHFFADSKDDIEKQLESLKRLPTIPERLMITASSSGTSSDEIIDSLNSTCLRKVHKKVIS